MFNAKTGELTDLHSHILPAVDDGPDTLAEVEKMLEWYVSQGFSTVVATSHLQSIVTPDWQTRYDDALMNVRRVANSKGIRIVDGAEVRLTPDIGREDVRKIGNTDYVLVDFPSGTWPFYADEVLFRLQILGYRPILAHPERYGWSSDGVQRARGLVKKGIILQVTLASFSGRFGRAIRQSAVDLLESGVIHLLATDSHNSRGRLEVTESAISWISKRYGEEVITALLQNNPSNILLGKDVEPVRVSNSALRKIIGLISKRS